MTEAKATPPAAQSPGPTTKETDTDEKSLSKDEKVSSPTSIPESKQTEMSQSMKKKRGADRQITQDDGHDDSDDDGRSGASGNPSTNGDHPKASEDVLKTRKIVRARRPGGAAVAATSATVDEEKKTTSKDNCDGNGAIAAESKQESTPIHTDKSKETTSSSNPFASVSLATKNTPSSDAINAAKLPTATTKPGVFGSKTTFSFGSGSTASSFNAGEKLKTTPLFGTSSSTTGIFGGGKGGFEAVKPKFTFGSSDNKTGFGSTSSGNTSGSIFGSATTTTISSSISSGAESNARGEIGSTTPSSPSTKTVEPPSNGEEDEVCLFQVRAKLFKLVEVDSEDTKDANIERNSGGNTAVVASVPPANKIGSSVPPSKTESNTADITEKDDTIKATSTNKQETKEKSKMDWKEVGIGPLRLLEKAAAKQIEDSDGKSTTEKKKTSIRIVQRRESTPGGQGTKLILNIPLLRECHVIRKGDKFVRLAAFEAVEVDTKNETKKKVAFEGVQYLFKVKTVMEADSLEETLKKSIKLL